MTCYSYFLDPIVKLTVLSRFLSNGIICKVTIQKNKTFDLYIRELLLGIYSSNMAGNKYCIDLAKRGAGCKNCKQKIDRGSLRIAKLLPNPFSDGAGEMKQWFHVSCIFETLSRARATTKKIEDPNDLEGWDDIDDVYKEEVLKHISEFASSSGKKIPVRTPTKKDSSADTPCYGKQTPKKSENNDGQSKDDSFREYRRLCAAISEEPRYNEKKAIVADFFRRGSDGECFKGDMYLWVKMLLPAVSKRIYNIQSKQLVKLFSQIFAAAHEEMLEDLEQGDVAETIRIFFESSESCPPVKKSTLTLQEVDNYLEDLSQVSREEEQLHILRKITKRCTSNDLKMIVRLIKHDLRINAGAKHILEAVHPSAYQAFQASRDLQDVIKRSLKQKELGNLSNELRIESSIMTAVLPMLAEPCRSIDYAFKKCPNGLLIEIKYDGERVQVHKQGNNFNYFSRSLKPVMAHKVSHFKDVIPKAFPHGNDLILDSEILLVDNDGKPLPFGTLGAHKKAAFKDASVCLFVFDCLQFNDQNLMDKPLIHRRKILQENMTPIKNKILFSEIKAVKDRDELKQMIHSVIQQGLEGLVIKDKKSIYEPGKRHWLKMKKDYLEKGAMADSADLVVLGAYYGTGNKGGMMSIFLMGCYNKSTKKWCTVSKVHGGHDDATLNRLQVELDMVKISKDPSKVPSWLNVNKALIPDFVSANPKEAPVWEITGAEFTRAEAHTADGISIRFPRVTRIRDDKTWREATSLEHLTMLYENSKDTIDMIGLAIPKCEEKSSDGDNKDADIEDDKTEAKSPEDLKLSKYTKKIDRKRKSPTIRKKQINISSSPQKKMLCETSKDTVDMIGLAITKCEENSSDDCNNNDSLKNADIEDGKTEQKSPEGLKRNKVVKRKINSESKSSLPSKKQANDISSSSSSPQKKFKSDGDTSVSLKPKEPSQWRPLANRFCLPDIFTGVKLFLPPFVQDNDLLQRYFIAFDGELLADHEKWEANFVITNRILSEEECPRRAKQITPDWLWDCIKLQRKLPIELYSPVATS